MVSIVEQIESEMNTCQMTRIIQWLGGEQAIDVSMEFPQPTKNEENSFQTVNDEAYSTLHLHSSSVMSSLSIAPHLSVDEAYATLSHPVPAIKNGDDDYISEDMSLLREIAQETPHILPLLKKNENELSMDFLRALILNDGMDEKEIKILIQEFLQLVEKKLSDTEMKMFNTTQTISPSLFDMLNDLKNCLSLLRRTEMQSLLDVFDNVLKLRSHPAMISADEDSVKSTLKSEAKEELEKLAQYGIHEMKIVQIEKTHQPLGLTISRNDNGNIHIARILIGGIAATSELFQVDDRILEINGEPMTGRSLDHVCTLMSNTTGLMKFLLAPSNKTHFNQKTICQETFHVRALYSYDPKQDPLIPCPELGLAFQRGDILRIVAYDEKADEVNRWWQAYQEKSLSLSFAGLIPSDHLQQIRTDLLKAVTDEGDSNSTSPSSSSWTLNHPAKKLKIPRSCFTCVGVKQSRPALNPSIYHNASYMRDIDDQALATLRKSTNHFSLTDTRQLGEEPSTTIKRRLTTDSSPSHPSMTSFRFYEPVIRFNRINQQIKRPIVLLGAPNVGRHELRRRLLQSESSLFDLAIPHTTRPPRAHEQPDIDYHFISEDTFINKIATHSFVEYGQYDGHLYGTSLDDIRDVVERKQKICILNLNPNALRSFDGSQLYPYVICIAAPSMERLKRLELDRKEQLTEKDYRDILRQSRSIERKYRLLFDHLLIHQDFERTYSDLHDLIVRIQTDDNQWIRACFHRSC